MNVINPTFIPLAQNYLATKERVPHYEIRSISDACPADGWCNLNSFSEKELEQLHALREKYGEKDFINHLNEIFDEDTLCDMTYGTDIISFDLDTEYFMYSFMYHQITENGVNTGNVKLNLTDATYVRLLALHLYDKDLNINSLRYADEELFKYLTREVDYYFCDDIYYSVSSPYTITMNEVRADAQKIREQHPEIFSKTFGNVCYII